MTDTFEHYLPGVRHEGTDHSPDGGCPLERPVGDQSEVHPPSQTTRDEPQEMEDSKRSGRSTNKISTFFKN